MRYQLETIAKANEVSTEVNTAFQRRVEIAQERFSKHVNQAYSDHIAGLFATPMTPWDIWANWVNYSTDFAQRSILFWDTLRKRGNNFIEHDLAGKPPVLHFKYETVLDARKFERPVNYALLRILPPEGVTVDPKRRPYVIIDPRAGHGPGIGGFKDDSQIGVALRDGHPVYFVSFFPQPEPGQTLVDVCNAEREFMRAVRKLHPKSAKPVVIGNCQGGWAAMMLAATNPDITGPLVINGAPMSYWSGAWSEGAGDNPMRYSGGLLGGSWLSSFAADLGDGTFDGAALVQNFENLNPANTFWDKYYGLFSNVDTESERFLEFERWWGGFYLMNKEEIEWIVQNLFVGNKLWSHRQGSAAGLFDLRNVKSPIILFASLGDNITPPQQAFNWVADTYKSTDEIKERGQVIIGLVHQDAGHLGIFVSGKVAKKEYAQIVSVLKTIEAMPPGLYAMHIKETKEKSGKSVYEVEFVEHRLEDLVERLNRVKRVDEKPFETVAQVSEFNQLAYEAFAQPLVQYLSNDYSAKLSRMFHPMRLQRWAFSDLNPWLVWLAPTADMVKAGRKPATNSEQPFGHVEHMVSELISASLDYYRDLRDAASEAMFFHTYGPLFTLTNGREVMPPEAPAATSAREIPMAHEALAEVAKGGYIEAVCRAGYLLAQKGRPLPLARFQLAQRLMDKYSHLLPEVTPYERRLISGKQEVICRYEPEKAVLTLPKLLSVPKDRQRFLKLLQGVEEDFVASGLKETSEQQKMLKRIRAVLGAKQKAAAASAR